MDRLESTRATACISVATLLGQKPRPRLSARQARTVAGQ